MRGHYFLSHWTTTVQWERKPGTLFRDTPCLSIMSQSQFWFPLTGLWMQWHSFGSPLSITALLLPLSCSCSRTSTISRLSPPKEGTFLAHNSYACSSVSPGDDCLSTHAGYKLMRVVELPLISSGPRPISYHDPAYPSSTFGPSCNRCQRADCTLTSYWSALCSTTKAAELWLLHLSAGFQKLIKMLFSEC